jgi:hypothetical protein
MPQATNRNAFGISGVMKSDAPCSPQSVTAKAPIRYAPPHQAIARMPRSCIQSTKRKTPCSPAMAVATAKSVV